MCPRSEQGPVTLAMPWPTASARQLDLVGFMNVEGTLGKNDMAYTVLLYIGMSLYCEDAHYYLHSMY